MADQRVAFGLGWGQLALGAIVLAMGCYVLLNLEWRDETTRTGFTGEARRNPYHAGMLLLEASGYPARRLDDALALDGLSPRSTLVLNSPSLFNNDRQARKLLNWVERGGHLALPLSRRNDISILLRALHVQTLGWNASPGRAQIVGVERQPLTVDLRNAPIFEVQGESLWRATLFGHFTDTGTSGANPEDADEEEGEAEAEIEQRPFTTLETAKGENVQSETRTVYARWKLGQGTVTAGDFAPFRNNNIEDNDHAELFVRLVTLPHDNRPVVVALTAEYPNFITWLARHASEALIALAALLVAVLWRAMPRFGPLLPARAPGRPGLLEHLGAVGDFLLREKQYEALLAPLREDVVVRLTHLRSRHPEIQTLPELGAHIAGLALQDVTLALSPSPPDALEFQRRSHTLATLRKHCQSMQNAFSPEGN